jgi:N-acyl-D-amino-acid deacylase
MTALSSETRAIDAAAAEQLHDLLIQGGTLYDGSGGPPYVGDLAISGDRIAYVGPPRRLKARRLIDARDKAVSPGFINMMSQAHEALLFDGRAVSDLCQGVTTEVTGEGVSMGPLTDEMARRDEERQGALKYPIVWRTLGEYLESLGSGGISPNIASFVGAATIRDYVLGEGDVQPDAVQLERMRELVRRAMREGALGVSAALIYVPGAYATTEELQTLAGEAARHGGIYIAHMRSEGDQILEALDETIAIARASGAAAEIYHLKLAGKSNWGKLDAFIAKVEAARAEGLRITADMYPYTAGATGLNASMPLWVQSGGLESWIERLRDPAVRERVMAEMLNPPPGFESALAQAGPEGTRLLAFKSPGLKAFEGRTLAELAALRGESPEATAISLVIEDGSRVGVAYSVMSEANLRRQIALPWTSFCSDEAAVAADPASLQRWHHPRAFGAFARILGRYVRDEGLIPLEEAIRKLTALPARNLSLKHRGMLKVDYFADVVVFDPKKIQDFATFEHPQQLARGVEYVLVNGGFALDEGMATGKPTGRIIRGPGWKS